MRRCMEFTNVLAAPRADDQGMDTTLIAGEQENVIVSLVDGLCAQKITT